MSSAVPSSGAVEPAAESHGSPSAILSCRNVWKIFGSNVERFFAAHNNNPTHEALSGAGLVGAVRSVTLDVRDGEIFVIMGLSGSGKSTLVRCMSRLIEPTAGQVIFEGTDLLKASGRTMIELRRHKMGMVFQHFALLPHLQVIDNVAFPLEVQGIDRASRLRRAHQMIDLVGLSGKEEYYPRELSGGQQQRVGIARSLAVEPDIWFLDEPFSALDPLIRREMQVEFLRLQDVLQKTIVFITHDFDEAVRLADRIAIMKDGEIFQIGTPEELVMSPATDYVAEFTRDIPRAKVLSVRSVMAMPCENLDGSRGVPAERKIQDIAEEVMSSPGPVPVQDESGRIIGQISREIIIKVFLNKDVVR